MNARNKRNGIIDKAYKYQGNLLHVPDWLFEGVKSDYIFNKNKDPFVSPIELHIRTLSGEVHVGVGDYIVLDVQGKFRSYKPEEFERIYEEV